MHCGKSDEFENSYSLLYILLKSCLCCYSLAMLAQQLLIVVGNAHYAVSDLLANKCLFGVKMDAKGIQRLYTV